MDWNSLLVSAYKPRSESKPANGSPLLAAPLPSTVIEAPKKAVKAQAPKAKTKEELAAEANKAKVEKAILEANSYTDPDPINMPNLEDLSLVDLVGNGSDKFTQELARRNPMIAHQMMAKENILNPFIATEKAKTLKAMKQRNTDKANAYQKANYKREKDIENNAEPLFTTGEYNNVRKQLTPDQQNWLDNQILKYSRNPKKQNLILRQAQSLIGEQADTKYSFDDKDALKTKGFFGRTADLIGGEAASLADRLWGNISPFGTRATDRRQAIYKETKAIKAAATGLKNKFNAVDVKYLDYNELSKNNPAVASDWKTKKIHPILIKDKDGAVSLYGVRGGKIYSPGKQESIGDL